MSIFMCLNPRHFENYILHQLSMTAYHRIVKILETLLHQLAGHLVSLLVDMPKLKTIGWTMPTLAFILRNTLKTFIFIYLNSSKRDTHLIHLLSLYSESFLSAVPKQCRLEDGQGAFGPVHAQLCELCFNLCTVIVKQKALQ